MRRAYRLSKTRITNEVSALKLRERRFTEKIRSEKEIKKMADQHGSAFLAAMYGQLTAEEYLLLINLEEKSIQ